MAINIEKMKEKLAESKLRAQKRGNTWKPENGAHRIRVVPAEDGDPFKMLWLHYNVGETVLCPKRNFDEDCPVCSFATDLYRDSRDKDDKDGMDMAKKLFVKDRYFSPILVRGAEDEGVKVWSYSKGIYEKLLKAIVNPDIGDFTDLDEGFDLEYTREQNAGKSFPDIDVEVGRARSSLCGELGEEKCEKLLESVPDFDKLYNRQSTEDVQAILDKHLTDSDDPESVSGETTKYGKGGDKKEASKVDTALKELMAN